VNPYLKAKREQYEALRATIEGLQKRAADEGRDLTVDELRSVQEQGEQARKLAEEIETLTEIQNRHTKVASMAVEVAQEAPKAEKRDEQGAERVGRAYTKDRDPGHYRKDGGYSFFGDLFAARSLQDEGAQRRLVEHNRALDMTNEGPGVIPPVWMTQEFAQLVRQQRKVANAVRNIPLSSAAPLTMPKQTSGTDSNVIEQSNEGEFPEVGGGDTSNAWDVDSWDSSVDTVAPKATAGAQLVSRQMLDSSNPAIDALIYDDLVSAYNLKVEQKVVAALVTAANAALTTYATEADWKAALDPQDDDYVIDAITDAAVAVRQARKLPADILVCSVGRYGSLLKVKDAAGRPLMPAGSAAPQNIVGRGDVATDGFLETANLSVLATDGVPASYPESLVVARASDCILFESPVLRFRYEEPHGPEVIRLGIWAYTATHVKYSGASAKRLVVTAAS